MKRPLEFWIGTGAISLLLLAVGLILALHPVTYTITANGETVQHRTRFHEPGQILADAGIAFRPQDRIVPPLGSILVKKGAIEVQSAVWVQVWEDGELRYETFSPVRIPAQHLQDSGIEWTGTSQLIWRGQAVDIYTELPAAEAYIFSIQRSADATLLDAIWQQGVHVNNVDDLGADWFTAPQQAPVVTIKSARSVSVEVGDEIISGYSAAETVGEALLDLGFPVQGLDRTEPALSAPLPEDGIIRVIRRSETIELQSSYTPYGSQMQGDPDMALDGRSLLRAGTSGIEVSRVRQTIENGVVVDTITEATWTASEPQDEIIGYGQQINTWTIDTEYGPLEVYREVDMYATSYHPCAFSDGCHYTTRNGCTLEKGVVAVAADWYPYMVGQQVYIPGYGKGVVCDSGWGIADRHWIDLGYADEDFINWHEYVPVYFLTPVPETVLWVLP